MGTPVVRLGSVVLEGANSYDWEIRAGVSPVERIYTITKDAADKLKPEMGKAQTLEIVGPNSTLKVEKVYPLEILPANEPYLRRLRVADLRWLWPRAWLAGTFNLRRAKGDKFITGSTQEIANKTIQPEIDFVQSTLYPPDDPKQKWTSQRVLDYFLKSPPPVGLGVENVRHDGFFYNNDIQDLIIDDQGHHAIERALAAIPTLSLYVDHDGAVVTFNTDSRRDKDAADKLIDGRLKTGPEIIFSDRNATRPSEIWSLFTIEQEIKLTFEENPTQAVRGVAFDMQNVMPIPDASLSIGGAELARGSYAELSDVFSAWGAFGFRGRQMSTDILRRNMFKHGFAGVEQEFGNDPNNPPDPVNALRARAAVQNFRTTYRINRELYDRCESAWPYRVAVLNTETGARAPSEAYADYTRRPAIKSLAKQNDPNLGAGWSVRGYNASLASAKPAPSAVAVADQQAGILRIVPQVDPFGLYQQIAFGYAAAIPQANGLGQVNRTLDQAYCQWDSVELADDFALSVVITVVPLAPQSSLKFYAVRARASDFGYPDATGPPIYSRIFPGVMSARFAWQDNRESDILAAMRGQSDWKSLEGLLVNQREVAAVARANARRVLSTYRDRPLGGADVDLDQNVGRLVGGLTSVRHVMAGGSTVTQARFNGAAQAVDLWRYLDSSTRRVVLRISSLDEANK